MDVELSAHDRAVLNCVFNPNLPLDDALDQRQDELKDIEQLNDLQMKTKVMEVEAIALAERGEVAKGLILINEAISMAPNRPSLYNNRAHIYLFMRKFDDAFNDVSKAIDHCTDNHKRTTCLAHCQRGVLYRRQGNLEAAKKDFEIAARMGNQFAKSQLVELNPYAALCNQMLRQVMDNLK